jgi:ferredoxin
MKNIAKKLVSESTANNEISSAASFTVTVEPENLQFSADATQTILQAAERAQIYPASSCRNGTCRTCMSTLISGDIRYNIAWPGLSAEEKQAGLMLPCCASPLSDLVMKLGA